MLLDARRSVVCLALSVLACACSAGERETVALGAGSDPSTVGNPTQSPADSSTATERDAGRCGALVEAAKGLLTSHRSCQVDADCRDEPILAPCPAPLDCRVFVRKDTDALWSASKQLEVEYEAECGQCGIPKCPARPTTRSYCDATKRCAGRPLPASVEADAGSAPVPAPDASTASAGPDASTVTPRADAGSSASPYACKQNLDCVITNVGNCCGYYPRCANVNATFAPPVCTGGQAGVCGFPSIDSCACRQNTCVSLQAGNPI